MTKAYLMAAVTAVLTAGLAAAQIQPKPPATPPAKPPATGGTAPPSTNPATGGTVPPAGQTPATGGTTARPATPFPTPLFQQADVSRTLNITDAQRNTLNTFTDQLQQRYRERFDQLGALPATDRPTRTLELQRQYANDWLAGARTTFNETQLSRYQQLQYQYGQFDTFTDPNVQRQLNLTEAQLKDLNDARAWSTEQQRLILEAGAADRERGMSLYGDYSKAYQERLNRFLNAEQQKAWRTLAGDPYTFTPQFPTAAKTPATPATPPKK